MSSRVQIRRRGKIVAQFESGEPAIDRRSLVIDGKEHSVVAVQVHREAESVLVVIEVEEAEERFSLLDDLLRFHVLVSVFDSDPGEWIRFLHAEGSSEQRRSDLPFAENIAARLRRDRRLARRMRLLVQTSAELLLNRRDAGAGMSTN